MVKWFIVWALVNLCGLFDKIPPLARWHHMATLSDKLDQRWKTGVWEEIPPELVVPPKEKQ